MIENIDEKIDEDKHDGTGNDASHNHGIIPLYYPFHGKSSHTVPSKYRFRKDCAIQITSKIKSYHCHERYECIFKHIKNIHPRLFNSLSPCRGNKRHPKYFDERSPCNPCKGSNSRKSKSYRG